MATVHSHSGRHLVSTAAVWAADETEISYSSRTTGGGGAQASCTRTCPEATWGAMCCLQTARTSCAAKCSLARCALPRSEASALLRPTCILQSLAIAQRQGLSRFPAWHTASACLAACRSGNEPSHPAAHVYLPLLRWCARWTAASRRCCSGPTPSAAPSSGCRRASGTGTRSPACAFSIPLSMSSACATSTPLQAQLLKATLRHSQL
jgi:hypothetical protein